MVWSVVLVIVIKQKFISLLNVCSGAEGTDATSQLQGLRYDLELRLLSFASSLYNIMIGGLVSSPIQSSIVLGFPGYAQDAP